MRLEPRYVLFRVFFIYTLLTFIYEVVDYHYHRSAQQRQQHVNGTVVRLRALAAKVTRVTLEVGSGRGVVKSGSECK